MTDLSELHWIRTMSSRFGLILLTLITLLGFAVRAMYLDRSEIEHFDEGVYASNYFILTADGKYPFQELYAPSLFPAILKEVLLLTGGNTHSVMWVNVLFGTLLIPAVWWTTREIVGDSLDNHLRNFAGLSAAVLTVFHGMFIEYSRAALTDMPAILWMTLAVGFGTRGIRENRILHVILAGLFTALAWWTKYNGWLPIAILISGTVAWLITNRPVRTVAVQAMLKLCLLTGIAIACWLPYLSSIQKSGGYAAVSQNHAQYVTGFSRWFDSLLVNCWTEIVYTQFLCGASFYLILLLGLSQNLIDGRKSRPLLLVLGIVACLSSLITGSLLWLILFSLAMLLLWPTKAHGIFQIKLPIGFWIISAWLAGLLLTTPLYTPYPRLFLPLLTGMCIASGVAVGLMYDRFSRLPTPAESERKVIRDSQASKRVQVACFIYAATGLFAFALFFYLSQHNIYQPKFVLRLNAPLLLNNIETYAKTDLPPPLRSRPKVIYVLGQPGLFYHLAGQTSGLSDVLVAPTATTSVLTDPIATSQANVFLVTETKGTEPLTELPGAREIPLSGITYTPSRIVCWDEWDRNLTRVGCQRTIQIWTPNP